MQTEALLLLLLGSTLLSIGQAIKFIVSKHINAKAIRSEGRTRLGA